MIILEKLYKIAINLVKKLLTQFIYSEDKKFEINLFIIIKLFKLNDLQYVSNLLPKFINWSILSWWQNPLGQRLTYFKQT